MALTIAALNYILDKLSADGKVAYMALFTDNIASIELTGGSPAYARRAVTWSPASGGVKNLNGSLPIFDVPACTVRSVGFYDSLNGGIMYGFYNVDDQTFATQGSCTVTAGSIMLT